MNKTFIHKISLLFLCLFEINLVMMAQDIGLSPDDLQKTLDKPFGCIASFADSLSVVCKMELFGQADVRPYHLTRFEGKNTGAAMMQTGKYLRKYKFKRFNYEHATTSYFNCKKHPMPAFISPDSCNFFRLAMVGDIMWVGRARKGYVSDGVLSYLGSFDVVVGNLESPIDTTRSVPNFLPDYLTFNSNKELITAFQNPQTGQSLFDVLTLANNHAYDRKARGLLNTMELLDRLGIAYTGVSTSRHQGKYLCLEQHGVKIGIYAATYGLNFESRYDPTKVVVNQLKGLAPPDRSVICLNEIVEVLEEMKKDGIDLKMVSLHWGYEFELFPDPLVQELARNIVLAGADVIVGSHPHVPQPVEVFYLNGYDDASETISPCPVLLADPTGVARKAVVFYSLGNFVTRMYTPMCQTGVIASINVFKENATGKTDWAFNEMAFVYNEVPFFPLRKHELMLLSDYHEHHLQDLSIKRQIQFKKETKFITKHIGNGCYRKR